jgi:hypothetical protein
MLSLPSGNATTTGLRTIASVDRIATCGWLMIAMVSTEPAEPLLLIVKVPPEISSGDSLRFLVRDARSLISRASERKRLSSALRTTGTRRPW